MLLQFAEPPVDIQMQHYAFLVDDELFARCLARIERGITCWAHAAPLSCCDETTRESVSFSALKGRACSSCPVLAASVTPRSAG
ncbi:hypothetical protein AB0H57_32340 [Micromonospora sp. NPDC050686]|uniref:hypothetical protein n=1 Tax=Micromonospora sp. NPDC050686 TaxID=3154631 RepID=UPI0033C4ACB4